MVSLVVPVYLEDQVDQESLVDQAPLDCLEIRVRQVGMGFQDQLESKETQASHRLYEINVPGVFFKNIQFEFTSLYLYSRASWLRWTWSYRTSGDAR